MSKPWDHTDFDDGAAFDDPDVPAATWIEDEAHCTTDHGDIRIRIIFGEDQYIVRMGTLPDLTDWTRIGFFPGDMDLTALCAHCERHAVTYLAFADVVADAVRITNNG